MAFHSLVLNSHVQDRRNSSLIINLDSFQSLSFYPHVSTCGCTSSLKVKLLGLPVELLVLIEQDYRHAST